MKKTDDSELIQLKMPFILKEYQNHCDCIVQSKLKIQTFHGWEITLLSGAIALLLSGKATVNPIPLAILLMALFCLFFLLECHILSIIRRITLSLESIESRLSVKDLHLFNTSIIGWQFYTSKEKRQEQQSKKNRIIFFVQSFGLWTVIAWHGTFFIIISTTVLIYFQNYLHNNPSNTSLSYYFTSSYILCVIALLIIRKWIQKYAISSATSSASACST